MEFESYFYNCSEQYIQGISSDLTEEMRDVLMRLPKRDKQAEINQDLWWLLTSRSWSFDSCPPKLPDQPPELLGIQNLTKPEALRQNQ